MMTNMAALDSANLRAHNAAYHRLNDTLEARSSARMPAAEKRPTTPAPAPVEPAQEVTLQVTRGGHDGLGRVVREVRAPYSERLLGLVAQLDCLADQGRTQDLEALRQVLDGLLGR